MKNSFKINVIFASDLAFSKAILFVGGPFTVWGAQPSGRRLRGFTRGGEVNEGGASGSSRSTTGTSQVYPESARKQNGDDLINILIYLSMNRIIKVKTHHCFLMSPHSAFPCRRSTLCVLCQEVQSLQKASWRSQHLLQTPLKMICSLWGHGAGANHSLPMLTW